MGLAASCNARSMRLGIGEGADLLLLDQDETGENDQANFVLRRMGQIGGQAIIPTTREAVFNSDIAAFDIANVTEATAHLLTNTLVTH
jgi:hypothetical protein